MPARVTRGGDIECVWCGNTNQFNGNLLVCGKGKAPSFTLASNQTSSYPGYPYSPSVTSSALEVRLLYGVTVRSASGNCYGDRTQFLPFTALLCPNKSENRTLHVIRVPITALEASLEPNNQNSVDKKNQLDVTICILYFCSNSCSTSFGQQCAHHQELTTAWCYSLVLVCAVAAGRWSSPVGR